MKNNTILKTCIFALSLSAAFFISSCDSQTLSCQHREMYDKIVPPTHEDAGYTEYSCLNCDYSYRAQYTAPVEHHLEQTEVLPTCTAEGYTLYSCECGYEYKSSYVAPLPHAYTSKVIAPTCDTEGYTLYTCKCGYSHKANLVKPLGHALSGKTVAPTCDAEGYTTADCSLCGVHYTYNIKAPLGHDLEVTYGYVSVKNGLQTTHYKCGRCELDYDGDFLLYKDVYHGAYVDNTVPLAKGLDVSYYQHDKDKDGNYLPLDWKKIKAAGYDFVILRAGYMGNGNVFKKDVVFEMNYRDAKAAGLDVGAYIYSYAYTLDDARAEAEAMLEALKGKQFEYPIFFDIEYSDTTIAEKGLTPRDITDICTEFISTMQENGYFTALYTNNKWLTEYLIKNDVTELFDIWYARYLYSKDDGKTVNEATWNTEKYGTQMAMWQFSETGIIEGINSSTGKPIVFDMNYCYKDYPTLIKEFGLNGFGEQKNLANLDGLYSDGN